MNPNLCLTAPGHTPDGMCALIFRDDKVTTKAVLTGDTSIKVIDIRTSGEFKNFHIRSAVNIQVKILSSSLASYKNKGLIVLYSNGMAHPAQASDSLFRLGFKDVYFLTDGLEGFLETCLKPAS